MKPTIKQYSAFESIFDYLNANLFDNALPDCMLRFSRKSNKVGGSFLPFSWSESENGKNIKHEISLNPLLLEKQNKEEILSVVCHNMVHLWQYTYSELSPESRLYHNKEWVEKMESIGLKVHNTGKRGGAQTGKAVAQRPKPRGRFLKVCGDMPDDYLIPFRGVGKNAHSKNNHSKTSYDCPACHTVIWGKPGVRLICEPCTLKALISSITQLLSDLGVPKFIKKQIIGILDRYVLRERPSKAGPEL